MNQTNAERIESLKAGIFGAIGAGLALGGLEVVGLIVRRMGAGEPIANLFSRHSLSWEWIGLVPRAIVLFSGFLFGVTYRYVMRQDQNPQLKMGAVMAFGLVRGLAHVGELAQWDGVRSGIQILDSVLLFTGAGLALDWALRRGWIKPFDA
ncbi:hypothetical protein [Egbenema bharatensis]|uniref:hypothetical protein n=1 Tax=Egbenema bharatensis TaxID=3463334 RepID=UPI003A8AB063